MTVALAQITWLPISREIAVILLDAGVKSVAVLALAGIALSCMKSRSAAARHLICFLAVASLPVLPILSWTLPGWRVLPGWMDLHTVKPVIVEQQAKTDLPVETSIEIPQTLGRIQTAIPTISAIPEFVPQEILPSSTPHATPSARVQNVPAINPPTSVRSKPNFWRVGFSVWLVGVLFAAVPVVLGVFSLHRLGWTSRRETAATWLELLGRLLSRLGLKRRVVLLRAAQRRMPMTWGVLHPKVLLPEESDRWPDHRRSVVLLHELAHAQRWDYLTHLITRLVCALYWFNPFVWLAARWMIAERERACDDIVLRHGAEPADYAEQVLEISAGLSMGWFAGYNGVAMARASNLEGRLRAILDRHRNRAAVTRAAVVAAILLLTAIIVPVAMMKAASNQSGSNPDGSSLSSNTNALVLGASSNQLASSRIDNRSSPTNGAQYVAGFAPEKSEITLGEPIYLAFNLTNTSHKTILMAVGGYQWSLAGPYRIQAFDSNGETVPDLYGDGLGFYRGGVAGATAIEPGTVFSDRIYLPTFIKFEKPGDYTIVASRGIYIYDDFGVAARPPSHSAITFDDQLNWVNIIDDFMAIRDGHGSLNQITNRFKLTVLPADKDRLLKRAEELIAKLDGIGVEDVRANADSPPALDLEADRNKPYGWWHGTNDVELRWVVKEVTEIGDKRIIPEIMNHLNDSSMKVRFACVKMLCALGETLRPEWIVPIIKSRRWHVYDDPENFSKDHGGTNAASILIDCMDMSNPSISDLWNFRLLNVIHGIGIPELDLHYNHDEKREGTPQEILENTETLRKVQEWLDAHPFSVMENASVQRSVGDWPWVSSQSERTNVLSPWLLRAKRWEMLIGTPHLLSVEDAVQYVLNEYSVVKFKGDLFGFGGFDFTLPSGRKSNSDVIECAFMAIFVPFGKHAIPALIDLLDNDQEYVRIGAFTYIQLITGRKDERYDLSAPKEARQQSIRAWQEWWERNKNNPRLDSLPDRVYDASEWDAAATTATNPAAFQLPRARLLAMSWTLKRGSRFPSSLSHRDTRPHPTF